MASATLLVGAPVAVVVFLPDILVPLGLESHLPQWRGNPHARHCANCSSFVMRPLLDYAEAHDGAFPHADDTTLVADLTKACCPQGTYDLHTFASGLNGHRDRTNPRGSFAYVNGLRRDDTLPPPADLRGNASGFDYGPILFYQREPSLWECEKHKMAEPGRVVLTTNGFGRFIFLPEAVFQRALADTLALVAARRAAPRDVTAKN